MSSFLSCIYWVFIFETYKYDVFMSTTLFSHPLCTSFNFYMLNTALMNCVIQLVHSVPNPMF